MKKEIFIKLMLELLSLREDEEKLCKAFQKFEPSFNYITFGRYEGLVVNVIKEAMNDEHDWVSYWLYELDEGKEAKKDTITDKSGKGIPIKTLDNLYDIITKKSI